MNETKSALAAYLATTMEQVRNALISLEALSRDVPDAAPIQIPGEGNCMLNLPDEVIAALQNLRRIRPIAEAARLALDRDLDRLTHAAASQALRDTPDNLPPH